MMDFRTFVDNAESDDAKESTPAPKTNAAGSTAAKAKAPAAPSMWSSVDAIETDSLSSKQPKPLTKPQPIASAPRPTPAKKPSRTVFLDTPADQITFPVGWLVVIAGPGRGAFIALQKGVSRLCRDAEGLISLASSESESPFVTVVYDADKNEFTVGKGSDADSTDSLTDGDTLSIGKTEIQFVAFCSGSFRWAQPTEESK